MDRSSVIAALAKMSRRRPETIEGHLSLVSLGIGSSFGLSALRSVLESASGAKLPVFTPQIKVDELVNLTNGGGVASAPAPASRPAPLPAQRRPINAPAPRQAPAAASAGQFGLGMDMQDISVLPQADDFRTDPFYASHFSPAEIATAALRPSPRAHLAGLFCAKEALKKSHPYLLNLRMDEIVVTHDSAGRPTIAVTAPTEQAFQFLVSITHTAQIAAATCVTTWG